MYYYTVYKITNTINSKIYIGCHKTEDVNDGYMGSGKLIRRAIDKYGIENFEKEILATFESEDQMFDEEKNLISKSNPDYNLHEGGNGGWGYININYDNGFKGKKHKKNGKHYQSVIKERDRRKERGFYQRFSSLGGSVSSGFTGKQHTEETKEKMRQSASKRTGHKNSQYGTMWITNGTDNKKIKKDIDTIPEGWYKGRS